MPRKDRTFNDGDVIRIFDRHLTRDEAEKVEASICRGVPTDSDTLIDRAFDVTTDLLLVAIIGRLGRLVPNSLKLFIRRQAKQLTSKAASQLKIAFRG